MIKKRIRAHTNDSRIVECPSGSRCGAGYQHNQSHCMSTKTRLGLHCALQKRKAAAAQEAAAAAQAKHQRFVALRQRSVLQARRLTAELRSRLTADDLLTTSRVSRPTTRSISSVTDPAQRSSSRADTAPSAINLVPLNPLVIKFEVRSLPAFMREVLKAKRNLNHPSAALSFQ